MIGVESISLQGVGVLNEDAIIVNRGTSIFGVLDGVSSLGPFRNKDNQTGGFIASNLVKTYFESILRVEELNKHITIVNGLLQKEMIQEKIDLTKKEDLWGTSLAIIKICDSGIEFVQTGDCMILVIYESGEVRTLTRQQVSHLEKDAFIKWRQGIEQGICTQKELYASVMNIFINNRCKSNTKVGYGVLNGEPDAIQFLEYGKINRIQVKHIILLSDGMFLPFQAVPNPFNYWEYIAGEILNKGIGQYTKDLLALEEIDPECNRYIRFKKSDDKTGMVISF